MSSVGNCVVCAKSQSSSDVFDELSEGKAFDKLCNLFQLSSRFRSKWHVRNSDFCNSCANLVLEAAAKCDEVRSLQRHINQVKIHLMGAMALSSRLINDDSDIVCQKDLSISNLRRILGQCWSPCTVQVSRLKDEEILELTSRRSKAYKRKRESSRSSRQSIAIIDDDYSDEDSNKCTKKKLKSNERSFTGGSAEESQEQDSDFRGSDVEIVLYSDDNDDFDTNEVSPKKPSSKANSKPHCARPSVCKHCSQSFPSRKTLKTHLREVHNDDVLATCKHCGINFETECRVAPIQEGDDKQRAEEAPNYICNVDGCKRTYRTLNQIRIHHSAKCPESPSTRRKMESKHVCNYCGKTYGQANYLRHHINSIHEKNFNFCCELCGAGFQQKSKFDRHVDYVHSTEKRFQCQVCKMQFRWPHMYKNHLLSHTGEKSFVCEFCGKGFATTSRLKAHKENVHSTQQFPCQVCGKLFPSKHYAHNHFTSTHLKARSRKAKNVMVDSSVLEPAENVMTSVQPGGVAILGTDLLVHPSRLCSIDLGHM